MHTIYSRRTPATESSGGEKTPLQIPPLPRAGEGGRAQRGRVRVRRTTHCFPKAILKKLCCSRDFAAGHPTVRHSRRPTFQKADIPEGRHSRRPNSRCPNSRCPNSRCTPQARHSTSPTLQEPDTSGTRHFRNPTLQEPDTSGTRHFRNPTLQEPDTSGTRHFRNPTLQEPDTPQARHFRSPTSQEPDIPLTPGPLPRGGEGGSVRRAARVGLN